MTTTVRLEPEALEALDKIGKALDRPRSWVIKEAVDRYLEYEKQYNDALAVGLEDVRAGRIVSHEDVKASLEKAGVKLENREPHV